MKNITTKLNQSHLPSTVISAVLALAFIGTSHAGTACGASADIPNNVRPSSYAINVGGDDYKSVAENIHYLSGDRYDDCKVATGTSLGASSSTSEIIGTSTPELYQTYLWGDGFSYELPIKDGWYDVTLKFAETYHNLQNERVMDVYVEDTADVNFDILNATGGQKNEATDLAFKIVQVTDGKLSIEVDGTQYSSMAKLNAILVEPTFTDSRYHHIPANQYDRELQSQNELNIRRMADGIGYIKNGTFVEFNGVKMEYPESFSVTAAYPAHINNAGVIKLVVANPNRTTDDDRFITLAEVTLDKPGKGWDTYQEFDAVISADANFLRSLGSVYNPDGVTFRLLFEASSESSNSGNYLFNVGQLRFGLIKRPQHN